MQPLPLPRPRGALGGTPSTAWEAASSPVHRQEPAGFGSGARPPTACGGDLDSLDLLLCVSGSPSPSIGSRPYTAPQPAFSPSQAPRLTTQTSLFTNDESLPLPGDGLSGTEAHVALPAPAAVLPASVQPDPAAGQPDSQSSTPQPQNPPQQLHVNCTYQSHPTSGTVPDVPAAAMPAKPQYAAKPPAVLAAPQHMPPPAAQQQQMAVLRARVGELERQVQEAGQRCTAAEEAEAEAYQALEKVQAEVAALQQRLESTNEAAVEQMLAEVDRLVAGKQQAEKDAACLEERLRQAEAERGRLEGQRDKAEAELAAAQQQLGGSQRRAEELGAESKQQGMQLAALKAEVAAAAAASSQAAKAHQQLQQMEAELAAATQQAVALAKQLAEAEAEAASITAAASMTLGRQHEAEAEAAAAEAQLQHVTGQLDECKHHLASGQQILREFEGHLCTVAAERDAALEQLELVEGGREEANRRLREAERKEAYNVRRQADLDVLQAEADGVVGHLREQQRALAAREREAAGREKQLALREKDADARESILREQQEDVAKQEEGALSLKEHLLHQQQEVERARSQLNQQRSALEAMQAQVQRDQATLTQERALMAELRTQRMKEQEALILRLAEERTAAARQQSSAERSVDAARDAELEAAKLLADLQTQALHVKQVADGAQERLGQLQERCAAEEARLAALQAAVLEQQQGFDAQVRTLLELGQQVKGQSEELSAGYIQLQESQAELEKQQRQAEMERKAAKAHQVEAEAAAQQAAEACLAAAAEQHKLGQERLESLRAAEVVRGLQLTLAAHVRAAVAAQVPQAAEVWQQLQSTVGGAAAAKDLSISAAIGSSAAMQAPPLEQLQAPAAAAISAPSPSTSTAAAVLLPATAALFGAPAALPSPPAGTQVADDSQRYRSILASLESSIDLWRGQLRAGESLTFASSGAPCTPGHLLRLAPSASLGGASFFLPPPAANASCCPRWQEDAGCGHSKQGKRLTRQRPSRQQEEEQQQQWEEGQEQQLNDLDEVAKGAEEDAELSSPSRAVQTTVSYLAEAPKAFHDTASSAPCSPASCTGIAPAVAAHRPASASIAFKGRGNSSSGSPGGSFSIPAGELRAVHGLAIPASFSVPGSPQHAKPHKWLKFKSNTAGGSSGVRPSIYSNEELEGCGSKGSWGGIFAFRRSIDGGGKQ